MPDPSCPSPTLFNAIRAHYLPYRPLSAHDLKALLCELGWKGEHETLCDELAALVRQKLLDTKLIYDHNGTATPVFWLTCTNTDEPRTESETLLRETTEPSNSEGGVDFAKISLVDEIRKLEETFNVLHKRTESESVNGLNTEDAINAHIRRLHEYNELKDVAQMLIGRMAEAELTTTRAVYEELGLHVKD